MSSLRYWQQHITFVLLTEGALGVVGGAESKLNAAGGEIALSSAFGKWARALSKAVDVGSPEDVAASLNLFQAERGSFFEWVHRIQSVSVPSIPSYSPLDEGGLISWWSPEADTSTPDATIVTRNDRTATGAHASEVAAGTGPTYKLNRFDGQSCLHFNLDGLFTSAAEVLDAINGTDAQFTLVSVHQVLTNAIQIPASFVNDTAGQFFQMRQNSFTYAHEISSTGAAAVISVNGTPFSPQVRVYRKLAGNLIQHGVDGVSETPQANTMGAIAMTRFGHGCLPDNTPFYGGNYIERHLFLFDGNKTDAELSQFFNWLRQDTPALAWKAGLGATAGHASGTLIVGVGPAQSNGAGRAITPYIHSAERVKNLHQDMFMRDFSDPATDPTDSVFIITDNGTKHSLQGRMADRFREKNWQQDLIFCNAGKSSTGTDSWVAGATVNPPPNVSNMGKLKQMLDEALKAPDAKIAFLTIYVGETNGAGEVANAADWGPHMDVCIGELRTRYAGRWYNDACRFVVVQLATNAPTGNFPEWEPTKSAIAAWEAAQSDTVLVLSGAATLDENVHQDMGADDTEGLRLVAVSAVDAWTSAVTP